MRIWDINPGYLNKQSLLGEHCELHAIFSIITKNKKGYSNHPEVKRWLKYEWALVQRHSILVAEMRLRGFNHNSSVRIKSKNKTWPSLYIDEPHKQFEILKEKYKNKQKGRIPLPQDSQQLWRHHKYSVLAREILEYKKIGNIVSKFPKQEVFPEIAKKFTEILRLSPAQGGIKNSLQHMWGYVSDFKTKKDKNINCLPLEKLLKRIQQLTIEKQEKYLLESTALSELQAWI